MKKLAKVLLGAVALSALFVGCNNGLVANDTLSSPDLRGFATDNGAIVIKWDAVKDADSYEVLEMLPGTEEWQNFNGTVNSSANPKYAVFNAADKKETSYKFKVVAKSTKANVLASSEAEISIPTPEAFAEYALDASKIAITLQPGTLNKYDVSFPVNAGYKYDVKFINVPAGDLTAKTLFACSVNDGNVASVSGSTTYNGAAYVVEKAENADGEEYEVAPVVDSIIVSADTTKTRVEDFYAVVKATPVNAKVGKTVYAVSSATATGLAANDATINNYSVAKTGATSARVKFSPVKANNKYAAPDSFVVYRVEKKTEAGWSTIGKFTKLGTPAEKHDLTATSATAAPVYIYDDTTVAAYDTTGKVSYQYFYYVVAAGNEDNVWTSVGNFTQSGTTAGGETKSASFSVNLKSATAKTVRISASYSGVTPTITYGKFASQAAAEKAVAEEVTTALPNAISTNTTTVTEIDTDKENGVTTSVTKIGGGTSVTYDLDLEVGKKNTRTTNTSSTPTTVVRETSDNGSYYVFVLTYKNDDGSKYVQVRRVYLEENVSTTNGTSSTSYSLTRF